jgi:hypothetical protein
MLLSRATQINPVCFSMKKISFNGVQEFIELYDLVVNSNYRLI